MTIKRLLAIVIIFTGICAAWFLLGSAVTLRTARADVQLLDKVRGNWGAEIQQKQPKVFYVAPDSSESRRTIQPLTSDVRVNLNYDPKKKGLLWYRTYQADFSAEYVVRNPTPIEQTIFIEFEFPVDGMRYDAFNLSIEGEVSDKAPENGTITESVVLAADAEATVRIGYRAAGMNSWSYSLAGTSRIRGLQLQMLTDFDDIDFPVGTESPTSRDPAGNGWQLNWDYSDVIGAQAIGMDMPAAINPGPVAARITFFAPVSLLFFFAVLVILGMIRDRSLHPMNYFFLGAGCFAFQLLFVYLVGLIPVQTAFAIAAAVSLVLVTGYLWLACGRKFALSAGVAQLFYLVLFSYSFFFVGLTGITVTVGAIVTLAMLMVITAKVDWSEVFTMKKAVRNPPPIPAA
ncbi:MAG: inner membrane CreD family protein [Limisphaerales bacterium]